MHGQQKYSYQQANKIVALLNCHLTKTLVYINIQGWRFFISCIILIVSEPSHNYITLLFTSLLFLVQQYCQFGSKNYFLVLVITMFSFLIAF